MDINEALREKRLEEIRVYLTKWFGTYLPREDALSIVIDGFYKQYQDEIIKANL